MERTINDITREHDEANDPQGDEVTKNCVICGRPLQGCLEGWTQNDVCSGRCWGELFGEP